MTQQSRAGTSSAGGPEPGPWSARHRANLIEELAAISVASDYTEAPADPAPSPRRQRVLVAVLALALAGFVLAIGVSARLNSAPLVADQKAELRDRIEAQEARQEELAPQILALRAEVEQARDEELVLVLGGAQLARDVRELELVTGYLPVTGPGVVVQLSDAPHEEGADDGDGLDKVLDSDVQDAVNGLWRAGAEAVAVNGQRLSARSAIRSAAGAILVNYRPLIPPYQVEAIGPPTLLDDFNAGPDAAALRDVAERFGIGLRTEVADELTLSAATTALPELAEPVVREDASTAPGEGDDR